MTKATSTVVVDCPASAPYTGSAVTPACTAKATGVLMADVTDLTVNFSNNTNAGTATASASWIGDDNHFGASGLTTFQIAKLAITVTANDQTKVYGTTFSPTGNEFSITSGTLVNAGDIASVTLNSPGAAAGATVGGSKYDIVPSAAVGPGAGNYDITYAKGKLDVTPKTLTITASDKLKAYTQTLTLDGSADFSQTGLVSGDKIASVNLTSAGLAAGSAVKTYPIIPSGATGSGLDNYDIQYVNGTLTVLDKTVLTITAKDQSKTYGTVADLGTTAFTVDGLKGSDIVTGVTLTSTGAAATASVAESTYPIVPSDPTGTGLDNYVIEVVNGKLTVDKAALKITANDRIKAVGTDLVLGTTSFTSAGLVGGDTVSGVTLGSSGADAGAAKGTFDITVGSALPASLATNYDITYVEGTLTVTDKFVLTVTADDKTRDYKKANPTFSFHIDGYQDGDDPSVVTTLPTCSTTATSASLPGTYQIICAGGDADSGKYVFSYTAGTLKITGNVVGGVTAPATTATHSNPANSDALPLFALLICAAFGGLGLLAVQAQRKSIRA